MKKLKLSVNEKILLPSTDYYNETLKLPAPKVPEIWRVQDGAAVLMFPDRLYMWITPLNFNSFEVLESEKTELTSQPNSSIIDSSTLLKAIAIAQNPNLAQSLIKD
jgi:hypothetical protein